MQHHPGPTGHCRQSTIGSALAAAALLAVAATALPAHAQGTGSADTAQPPASSPRQAGPGGGPGSGRGPGMVGPGGGAGPGMMGPGGGAGPGMMGPGPAGPRGGASAPRGPRGRWGSGITPGWSMMTPQERDEHRVRMQGARTSAECRQVFDEHRALMDKRAAERGVRMTGPRGDPCSGLPDK